MVSAGSPTDPALRLAIGLGSSLGDRRARLELTLRQLDAHPGLRLIRGSRWYRSPPLAGGTARNWFLNGVGLFEVDAPLDEVLALCQRLEGLAGRRRAHRWGDRPLDLDLLVAEGITRDDPLLVVPHPAIAQRAFVLRPLLEVWPDAVDGRTHLAYRHAPAPAGPRPWPVGVVASPRRLLLPVPPPH